MTNKVIIAGKVLLGIALSTSWAAIAQAQTVEPQSDAENARQASGDELGEIVVTARKREESLRDVPLSISALSGAALSEKQIVNQAERSVRVPNYQQTNGVNVASFMRGVDSVQPGTKAFSDPSENSTLGDALLLVVVE